MEYEEGKLAGALLASHGWTVCTGGYGGVMEAVSRGAKKAGGRVLGVTSRIFGLRAGNRFLDEEVHTDTLVERVRTMIELGHGYLALKGGIGTLAEISLVWSLLQTHSLPPRPFILLEDPWADLVKFCSARLIIRPQDLHHLQLAADADSAVQALVHALRGPKE
jgi:uncharacterized protein (TIGR00730 family)